MGSTANKPVILILGATADIGQAIARQFAANGHPIQLAARRLDRLSPIRQDLEIKYGVTVSSHAFDALAFDRHEEFFRSLDPKPGIAVLVFGYLGEQAAAQDNFEIVRKILNTNFTGAVSIGNILANAFEKQQQGSMIGISSVAGERGRQSNYFYGSAKAGFTTYLSGLRNRLHASGVHVMTVKPGYVRTKMTEGMALPPLLTASPDQAGKAVYKGWRRKKNVVFVLGIWRYIMAVIVLIPEFIFKKLKL